MENKKTVFVIGHKNPDTDSICSAIAYAKLKSSITGEAYVPARAGHLNEESQYVLDRFRVKAPQYIKDVRTQVRDIEFSRMPGGNGEMSLKTAWQMIREKGDSTLPVVEGDRLVGLITVGNIANAYMDVYDSAILSAAGTGYHNIVSTLEGELVVGDESENLNEGKVLIAAANPEMMENYIEHGDVVILGNRYEAQLCAIEMDAGCIIVCEGATVSMTIKKLAGEHGCKVITTPHDAYTVARLINQSMPIRYFMKTDGIISFHENDYIEDIQVIMAKKRHRQFPILDDKGHYVGMISRRNLLGAKRKQIILVDHNEKNQAVEGAEDAQILEIIDHHRLGTIETMSPVFFRNQPLGCTATIIYQMYQEHGVELDATTAGLLCAAIVSDTLMYRSPTCTQVDKQTAQTLAERAGIVVEDFAAEMFKAGSNLTSKTTKEVVYQDFKKFTINDETIGIGQINSMSAEELEAIRCKIQPYLGQTMKDNGLSMVFFMLTNILEESSQVVFEGKNAEELLSAAFMEGGETDCFVLDGVVSRKKQLLPALMEAMQQ